MNPNPVFIVRDPYDSDVFRFYMRAHGERAHIKPVFTLFSLPIWTISDLFGMDLVERLERAPANAFPVAVSLRLHINDSREAWGEWSSI